MHALRFDALTRRLTTELNRRSLGLLALLGLPGLVAPDPAAAKKKKRKKKKRCPPCKTRKKGKCKGTLPDGTSCPGGACQGGICRTDLCPGEKLCEGECIPTNQCCTRDDCPPISNYRCCNGVCTDEKLDPGTDCLDHSECCSDYCRLDGPFKFSCAETCFGKRCTSQGGCCRGFSCDAGYCGGCGDSGGSCENDAGCCFSACTTLLGTDEKRCLSYPGGPCARSIDCRSCYYGGNCGLVVDGTPVDICQGGVCGCPEDFECCSNADCEMQDETCVFELDGPELRGVCKPVLPG